MSHRSKLLRMATANPKPAGGPAIFSAVIVPHRSLSPNGFVLLMVLIGAIAFLAGLFFFLLGAWPVVGFLGLDVVLIWLAFRASYRAARARETVEVSETEIVVRRFPVRGAASEWRFNPYWARLIVERDEDDDVRRLALASHGRELEIAGWLSSPERAEFASALSGAMAAARRMAVPG
jgi:uncharacterized membrane protein